MAMFGRATRNDVLRSYTPTMAERIPIAVQGFLGRLGLNKYQARSFGQPIADVLGYSPVGAVAQSWDAGQAAARAPGMFGKAAGLGGGMALAALGAVPGGKALAGKGEALAMDKASRMARAEEMGFDTSRTLYHGTGAAIDEFQPSLNGTFGPGVYATPNKSVAGKYAQQSRGREVESPNVVKFHTSAKLFPVAESLPGKAMPDADRARLLEAATPAELAEVRRFMSMGYTHDDALSTIILRERGAFNDKHARQRVIESLGYGGMDAGNEVVIFDPKNIRRTTAAFDPAKRNSANLLAGLGAGAMLAPSMFGNRGGER